MSQATDRQERQARIEREWDADQRERVNRAPTPAPALDSAEYCPVNRIHSTWTSKQDGKRRCWYCCGVFDAVTGTWLTAREASAGRGAK